MEAWVWLCKIKLGVDEGEATMGNLLAAGITNEGALGAFHWRRKDGGRRDERRVSSELKHMRGEHKLSLKWGDKYCRHY